VAIIYKVYPEDAEKPLTVEDIRAALKQLGGYGSLFIPEFTHHDKRIDGVLLEPRKRLIRGFEIKLSRADFLGDQKWQLYSEFCSSLSIACPRDLIKPEEVAKPFGLVYISSEQRGGYSVEWVKRPKNFQRRGGLAWTWKYLEVLELEFRRVVYELEDWQTGRRHL